MLTKAATAVAAACTLVATIAPAARPIDVVHSTATFSVQHIWVDNVTGTVPILRGSVTVTDGSLIPEAVTAVLDATRIKTGEPDRDRSLESSEFFDAAKFPHWGFASTKIVPQGPNAFEMDGDLTLHGQTQPEVLDVAVSGTAVHPRYHAAGHIDRHAFGMTRTRLDPTIGSTVTVTLDVTVE